MIYLSAEGTGGTERDYGLRVLGFRVMQSALGTQLSTRGTTNPVSNYTQVLSELSTLKKCVELQKLIWLVWMTGVITDS